MLGWKNFFGRVLGAIKKALAIIQQKILQFL